VRAPDLLSVGPTQRNRASPRFRLPCSEILIFARVCVVVPGSRPGIALESPDQKTRGFVVQIALPR
jgi:hypothetical protein